MTASDPGLGRRRAPDGLSRPFPGGGRPGRRRRELAAAAAVAVSPRSIGGREWIALPDFGIACIQARLDPDAEASTLSALDVSIVDLEGARGARFSIRPIPGDDRTVVWAEAPIVSSADAGDRVIRTRVTLDDETWPVDLLLVSRHPRQTRIQLGRAALAERFDVRPGKAFLAGPPIPTAPEP